MHARQNPYLLHVALLLAGATLSWPEAIPAEETKRESGQVDIHVGIDAGDLRGKDQRALQAAVDYVAGLGGGKN